MMKLTNLAGEAEESLELMIEKQVDVGDKMRECQEQIVSVHKRICAYSNEMGEMIGGATSKIDR